jgi:predicted nucleic-acid-binding protein
VIETVTQRKPMQIGPAIEAKLNDRTLTFQVHEVIQSTLLRFCARHSMDFIDCLVVEFAGKSRHLPFGTFDRRLGRPEGARLLFSAK